jgi:hypothetical protein
MITSALPVATKVQAVKESPTRAAARPLIITLALPLAMAEMCPGHGFPGRRCGVDTSPALAAPRPLMITSADPVAIVYPLQCGTPASPLLAAAGTFYLHQSLKLGYPGINLIVLLLSMRAWRDCRTEFYHMIKRFGYVFIPIKFLQLTRDHDHESVRHASQ